MLRLPSDQTAGLGSNRCNQILQASLPHEVNAMKETGISNRETAPEEATERSNHPPADTTSPPPEDAAGRVGETPLTDIRDRHTSHKAGSRSIAQKKAESRYPDRSTPPSRKVGGAFGREPQK